MWETQVQSLVRKISGRRKWQPTPVFLPGKSQGQRSLVDYSPWGHKESDTTEWLNLPSYNATVWDTWQRYFLCVFHQRMTPFKEGLCWQDYVTSLTHQSKVFIYMHFLKTHVKFHLQVEERNLCLATSSLNLRNKLYLGEKNEEIVSTKSTFQSSDIKK